MEATVVFLCVFTFFATIMWRNVDLSGLRLYIKPGGEKPKQTPEDRIKALEEKIKLLMEICGSES